MVSAALSIILLIGFMLLRAVTGDEHSVYYLYTMQSKYSLYNIYDCTAVTLLDGRQIYFYNSTDESRTPKQNWMKQLSESDCARSTEKLKYDGQQLNKLLDIQMNAFGHFQLDGHVLQWIYGCEGELHPNGSVTVLNSTNAYGYDGEDLIHFDCNSERFLTPKKKKNRDVEEKWNSYVQQRAVRQCKECEDLLKMYLKYNTTESKPHQAPPDVYIFTKKSIKDRSKLILTCMTTHFYPTNVKMRVRKSGTSIPEHLITTSGVRPNEDGTYQLRKSVEIPKDDTADYACFVTHSSLQKPETEKCDERCADSTKNGLLGLIIGVWVLVLVVAVCSILWLSKICGPFGPSSAPSSEDPKDGQKRQKEIFYSKLVRDANKQ